MDSPLKPLPRLDLIDWAVRNTETDEVVVRCFTQWEAEEVLDELALTDPALHAVCVIEEIDPNGNDDRRWTEAQVVEALR